MAKGKQGLEAARRRAEAATEHIDRLTDAVVDYKMRTRRVEADAARVPGLERRVRDLEQQLRQATTPMLEGERQAHQETKARLTHTVRWLTELLGDVVETFEMMWEELEVPDDGSRPALLSVADMEHIDQIDHEGFTARSRLPRQARRTRIQARTVLGALSAEDLRARGIVRIGSQKFLRPPEAAS